MKWERNDSYLERTRDKAQQIVGRSDKRLPWWFGSNILRPILKTLLWDFAVMFGVNEEQAKAGYRLGFIAGGQAFIGDEILHLSDAIIHVTRNSSWTFFAVDLAGEVIPDEGGIINPPKNPRFWVDKNPANVTSCTYLDYRDTVD